MKPRSLLMTISAGVLAASMVVLAPLSAEARTWGMYYFNTKTASDTWHTSSASRQPFNAARTTANSVIAFVKVPGVGTTSGESVVTSTFSSRIVQASCKFQAFGFYTQGTLKCENGS